QVGTLSADPVSGDLYMAYRNVRNVTVPSDPGVFRIDSSTGELLDRLEVDGEDVQRPQTLTVGSEGDVFVFDQLWFTGASNDPLNHSARILRFDSAGSLIETIAEVDLFGSTEIEESSGMASSSVCYAGEPGLYVGAGD